MTAGIAKLPTRRSPHNARRGTALLAVIPLAILMMSAMVAFVGTAVDTSRATVSDMDSFRARAAAQSAASLAITRIWGDFDDLSGGAAEMWAFRAHLDAVGLLDQADANRVEWVDYLDTLRLPQNADGDASIDGVRIDRIDAHRIDNWDSTMIVIAVDAVTSAGEEGSSRERRSSIEERFTVAPPEWNGLDFALLASNINCLLCHTTIDNVERAYNTNSALTGTFDSVRIGSIDAIHFRSDPDSSVAGITLLGRDALLGDGTDVTDWGDFNLSGAKADAFGSVEKIQEDRFGNPEFDDLLVYDPSNPDAAANLFLDFLDYQGATDYELPESFPPPFPDNGGVDPTSMLPQPENAGNRKIDDGEFFATVLGLEGTITGGSISVMDPSERISTNAQRKAMMDGSDSVRDITTGNVYLHGTEDEPLILDGNVAIDGDVIISGVVKGMGTVRARGNVYVVSDLQYADGGRMDRTFGVSSDGTENNIAIAAGGNIVVGDYYRPAWGEGKPATGESDGSFNFTMDELAIFNRMEWMKTQPTLPGKRVKVQTGTKVTYQDEKVKEKYQKTVTKWKWVKTGNKIKQPQFKWITVSNGLPGEYEKTERVKVPNGFKLVDEKIKVKNGTKTVTKTRWVKTGNKIEVKTPIYGWKTPQHDNPYFNAYHTPRYYSFTEGSTVPIYNRDGYFDPKTSHWMSEEHAGEWSDAKLTYANPKNQKDSVLYGANGVPKAVVSQISPTSSWISPEMMRKTIEQQLATKDGGNLVLEIDATLYSANSILGTVPDRESPFTNGELLVNGGIVAADVGILAPNGTTVNYDVRGARALSIQADSGLVIQRRLSTPGIDY
ncbi:MAG: hypothetical protein AAGA20_11245 [Planctomycetota bacterium]